MEYLGRIVLEEPQDAQEDMAVYGKCTACGAVETKLNRQTGTINLAHMGESDVYPTGYGCELCD